MTKRLVLLARDTQTLAQRVDRYLIPTLYCESIVAQLKVMCSKRGIDFVTDCGTSKWTEFHTEIGCAEDTLYLSISPYESLQKIAFLQAKNSAPRERFFLMWSGFLANLHPSYSSMRMYSPMYGRIIAPFPLDVSGFFGNFSVTGEEAIGDEELTIIHSGFPTSSIVGKARKIGDKPKVCFLVETQSNDRFNILLGASQLTEKYDVTIALITSGIGVYNESIATYEMDIAKYLGRSIKVEEAFNREWNDDIVVQTIPYSPMQMYFCSSGVTQGCQPVFFDPLGLYLSENLETFSTPFNMATTVQETVEFISAGENRLGYPDRFFNSYMGLVLDYMGLTRKREGGLIQ